MDSRRGLSDQEARERLALEGYNDLPSPDRHSLLEIAFDVVREPMFALLLAAAVLYGAIGDLLEALVLFAFATASVSIAVIQRGRSERVLDALRDLTSPRALVIRDDERRRIPGREVVRGDVIVLAEGDRVPADATLFAATGMQVDESLLTGESVPVRKLVRPSDSITPGGDDQPHVFSGTLIVRGSGLAEVRATGVHSEIGKIGRSVATMIPEPPRLQAQTHRLVVIFAWVAFSLSTLAVVLYGLLRGDWLHALLGGIALGMSMLPEEFPLVLTVFMVMGAWRLSKSRVLTRQAAAIETLGAATVLCTDKTGTLTRNSMSVVTLQSREAMWRTEDPVRADDATLNALLRTATLASEPESLDPMERALREMASRWALRPAAHLQLARVYPLTPQLLALTHAWCTADGQECTVATKGAPEAIARLCRLAPDETGELLRQVDALAAKGIRVLAVACASDVNKPLPEAVHELSFKWLGCVGFADPLRDSVPEAMRECRSAGIRVVMITGDYPATARAIARQAGLDEGELLTGTELATLDDAALAERARAVTVFARITPQQKLRIVQALKANGEVVAMTGDGVNDAPALKAAHIGIAMGGRGTDVAREAASLVLLDDDFGSIVRAVRLGRRIYDNLRKAMGYILAIHVPIAGLALLPILLGWPLVLTPMLIAFLELIIDPACSVVLEAEPEERAVMQRPPRDPRGALISRSLAAWSLLQGVVAFACVGGVFLYTMTLGISHDEVRAIAFVSLVMANIALIFVNRTFEVSIRTAFGRWNPSLWWGLGVVVCLLALMLSWSPAARFFDMGPVHWDDFAVLAVVSGMLIGLLQVLKFCWRRRLSA